MVKTKGLPKKQITSRQRKRYAERRKRDWHNILVRRHVHEMITADRRSSGETLGDVIGRWARDRKNFKKTAEGMTTVFIAPEQTERVQ